MTTSVLFTRKCVEQILSEMLITKDKVEEILNSKEYPYKEIYGAIWTDKGLIFVAKMNSEGVLELL